MTTTGPGPMTVPSGKESREDTAASRPCSSPTSRRSASSTPQPRRPTARVTRTHELGHDAGAGGAAGTALAAGLLRVGQQALRRRRCHRPSRRAIKPSNLFPVGRTATARPAALLAPSLGQRIPIPAVLRIGAGDSPSHPNREHQRTDRDAGSCWGRFGTLSRTRQF